MRLPILLALMLALPGCNEDEDKSASTSKSSKVAETARIEKMVARRVEAAKLESTVRTSRLHTIRIVGFTVLAGGAVAGLLWVRRPQFQGLPTSVAQIQRPRPALWNDHHPPRTGRVIDFPLVTPARQQARQPDPRNRNRNYHHETPRRS